MTQPKRQTRKSFQVPVRLPQPLYDELRRRPGSVAGQIVQAVEMWLEREQGRAERLERRKMGPAP